MSKRVIGIVLIVVCLLAYYLLSAESATSSIWQTELNDKILSDPIAVSGNYIFWGGNKSKNLYKLYLINSKGQKVAESQNLPNMPFDPIVIGDKIIMADHGRMLRAFSSKDLKVLWEVASNDPFELPPTKCETPTITNENNSLAKSTTPNVLQMSGKSIFCFDFQNGKPLWDFTVLDGIKNYASDKVLIAIHGYRDIAKPVWKCTGCDLEDGLNIWEFEESVSKETPIFVKNTCILTTSDGEAIVVDQLSGKVLLRSEAKGYIAVKALEEGVILANESYTTFVYWSLLTGKSWTSSLKKDFVGAVQLGSRLIVADKVSLRCFEIDSGILVWQKDLGDVYGCYPHRNGVFVTYKDDFASRTTYGACFGADSSKNFWLAKGNSIFRKPCLTPDGDLLVNYDGTIRLMPKPVFKTVYTQTLPKVDMPDPTEKINKAFEQKSSNPASNTKPLPKKEDNRNPAIPTVLPPVSDEDAGW